jgi:hypothetical protein
MPHCTRTVPAAAEQASRRTCAVALQLAELRHSGGILEGQQHAAAAEQRPALPGGTGGVAGGQQARWPQSPASHVLARLITCKHAEQLARA